MKKYSLGRMLGGMVLGVLGGVAFPLFLMIAPVFVPTPAIISLLWVWSGPVGAMATTLCTLGMAGLLGGWGMVWPCLIGVVLPGWILIALVEKRMRFYEGIKIAVVSTLAMVLAMIFLLWLNQGRDLIQTLIGQLDAFMHSWPEELADQMLLLMGRMGLLGNVEGVDFLAEALTAAQRDSLMDVYLQILSVGLRLTLPSMLVNSAVVSAMVGYVAPLRVCQRRGDEPPVSLAPLRDWRLTTGLIIGPAASALVCYVADMSGLTGADSAYYVMFNLAHLLFALQGMGAVERKMRANGVSRRMRLAAQVALVVLGYSLILPLVGLLSALFGSKGLITEQIRKRINKDKEDEDS